MRSITKRAIAFYRLHGFWGFVKAASMYLLKKWQRGFARNERAKCKYPQGETRIFYIDYFTPENSNFYWLKAFKKFAAVETFDIIKERKRLLKGRIIAFSPHHIHLGGSVKHNIVPPQLLHQIKNSLGCTISAFYGDGYYSTYHSELARVIDYVYVSDRTNLKINKNKGLQNFKYMPCPTDPDIFRYEPCEKIHDLVFIGSNNQPDRLPLLRRLAGVFNLKVFGSAWEETGLDYRDPLYGEEFSRVCNKAKICLGIVEPKRSELEAYFSNRLVNTLATSSFYIQTYTPGLETVFTNREHLVWYTNEDELFELIQYYLNNEKRADEIATEGQKEVYEKYTYDKSVENILLDVGQLAEEARSMKGQES